MNTEIEIAPVQREDSCRVESQLPSPLSIIPDPLGDMPARYTKEATAAWLREKPMLHNPLGPRWYRNRHLVPPVASSSASRSPTSPSVEVTPKNYSDIITDIGGSSQSSPTTLTPSRPQIIKLSSDSPDEFPPLYTRQDLPLRQDKRSVVDTLAEKLGFSDKLARLEVSIGEPQRSVLRRPGHHAQRSLSDNLLTRQGSPIFQPETHARRASVGNFPVMPAAGNEPRRLRKKRLSAPLTESKYIPSTADSSIAWGDTGFIVVSFFVSEAPTFSQVGLDLFQFLLTRVPLTKFL